MEKTFEQAKDLHIAKYVAYGKAADHKLYYTSDYTTQVTQADAEDAMKKGMLQIIDGTTILVPVAMAANTVSTIGTDDSAVVLVEWTTVATAAS